MWNYIEKLQDTKSVVNFLKKYNISLPSKLISLLENNNEGVPSNNIFDTENENGYVFHHLISYNKDSEFNIYDCYTALFANTNLFPIAIDVNGNFICYELSQEEFYLLDHEAGEKEKIIGLEKILYAEDKE